jgi:hypothetical protein
VDSLAGEPKYRIKTTFLHLYNRADGHHIRSSSPPTTRFWDCEKEKEKLHPNTRETSFANPSDLIPGFLHVRVELKSRRLLDLT